MRFNRLVLLTLAVFVLLPLPAAWARHATTPMSDGVLASVKASVDNKRPSYGEEVTVTVTCKDGDGEGLQGVKVVYVWHYKTSTPRETRRTDADGVASCTRDIGRATKNYRVKITITATYKGVTKKTTTSFVPRG
jgi:competence protein ComEC